MAQMNLSLSDEEAEQLSAIKKACEIHGIAISKFMYKGAMHYFNTGKWGEFFGTSTEEIFTTEEILHDNMQNDLHRESKWIKL